MNIGDRIRAIRKRVGMNQTQLGIRVSLSQAKISAIENGHMVPSGELLVAIARALGVSVAELFKRQNH